MARGAGNLRVHHHDADHRQQPAPHGSDVRDPPMSTTLVPPSYYVVNARGLRASVYKTVSDAAAAIFTLAPLPTTVMAVTGSRHRSLTATELRELGRSVRACRLIAARALDATDEPDTRRCDPRCMNVLVAYASKRGSTAEIAEAIADKLRECGLGVDCRPVGDVDTLEAYDAVVLGSAVYARQWPGDARRFVRRHAEELSGRMFWVFSSGPAGEPGRALSPASAEPGRIVARLERLGVREHVVFGGRLLAHPRNRLERALVKRTPFGYRDRRDWREIRAWASGIAAELGAERPVSLACV